MPAIFILQHLRLIMTIYMRCNTRLIHEPAGTMR